VKIISGDEEVKVGYNTFYWMLYNSKKYAVGYNREYFKIGGSTFWVPAECTSLSELNSQSSNWTLIPPGEYIISSTDSWVIVGDNVGMPEPVNVYVCEMNKPDVIFRKLFGINYKFKNGHLYGYAGKRLVSDRVNYRGAIPSKACEYPSVSSVRYKSDCFSVIALDCRSIACVKIKRLSTIDLEIQISDSEVVFSVPVYAFVDGKLRWINSGEKIQARNITSRGPVFKVHYDPLYPNAVRTDKWTCGEITLLNLPKPKKEIYDLDYDDGYLYFRSNYSGQAELVVGKSVKKIQVKKGINKAPLTVDKETVVCVNPV